MSDVDLSILDSDFVKNNCDYDFIKTYHPNFTKEEIAELFIATYNANVIEIKKFLRKKKNQDYKYYNEYQYLKSIGFNRHLSNFHIDDEERIRCKNIVSHYMDDYIPEKPVDETDEELYIKFLKSQGLYKEGYKWCMYDYSTEYTRKIFIETIQTIENRHRQLQKLIV